MSASLFMPKDTLPENEINSSSPPSRLALNGNHTDAFDFDWLNHPGESGQGGPFEAIVSHYESRLDAANGVVLHFGADRGGLMDALRRHGFSVMGCEPLPHPTRLAREKHGFDTRALHCSNAESFLRWLRRIGEKAQAVFFRHGLEHNLELQALLPKIAEILHDEGRIIALLPPSSEDYPRTAHLSLLTELAVGCASCGAHFEVEGIDCDLENRFTGFVLKKTPARPYE